MVSPEYLSIHNHILCPLVVQEPYWESSAYPKTSTLSPSGSPPGSCLSRCCRDVRWHVGCLDEVSLSLCWDACLPQILADTRSSTGLFINRRSSSFPLLPWLPRNFDFVSSSLHFYLPTCSPSSLLFFLLSPCFIFLALLLTAVNLSMWATLKSILQPSEEPRSLVGSDGKLDMISMLKTPSTLVGSQRESGYYVVD